MATGADGNAGQQLLVKPSFFSKASSPLPLSPEMANQGNNAAVVKWEILTRVNRKKKMRQNRLNLSKTYFQVSMGPQDGNMKMLKEEGGRTISLLLQYCSPSVNRDAKDKSNPGLTTLLWHIMPDWPHPKVNISSMWATDLRTQYRVFTY